MMQTLGTGSRRRGAIVLLVALAIPVLLVIVGFSVDLAQMQRTRTELRAATDMAAKAACTRLADTGNPTTARQAGEQVAAANTVDGVGLTLAPEDFEFGRTTKSGTGRWVFTAGAMPTNAVRISGRRTNGSADGAINLFFSGFLGYQFQPTTTATAAFVDVDICLVLDRSSSMKLATTDPAGGMTSGDSRECQNPLPDSRWVALDAAVNVFVNQLNTSLSDEHVAVVTFASSDHSPCGETNTDVSVDQNLTSNLNLVSSAMNARSNSIWNGNTKIKEGIKEGRTVLTGASARPLAQKIMILLTDGVYTSGDPVPEAEKAYNDYGITIHTITFSVGANQTDMQAVAAAGHGQHYHAADASTLNDVFYELAGAITILTD